MCGERSNLTFQKLDDERPPGVDDENGDDDADDNGDDDGETEKEPTSQLQENEKDSENGENEGVRQNGEEEDLEDDDSDDDVNVVIGDIKTTPSYTSLNIKRTGLLATTAPADKSKQVQQPGKFTGN